MSAAHMQPIEVLYLESRPGSGRSVARRMKARGFDVLAGSVDSFSNEVIVVLPMDLDQPAHLVITGAVNEAR